MNTSQANEYQYAQEHVIIAIWTLIIPLHIGTGHLLSGSEWGVDGVLPLTFFKTLIRELLTKIKSTNVMECHKDL